VIYVQDDFWRLSTAVMALEAVALENPETKSKASLTTSLSLYSVLLGMLGTPSTSVGGCSGAYVRPATTGVARVVFLSMLVIISEFPRTFCN
jgi:hypothetical protein